jgi:hypothetical protein
VSHLDDCRVGLGCHEGICEDVACWIDLGGFCGRFGRCGTPNSFCDDTGHCANLPVEGEPCADWPMECANDLICDPASERCTPRPPLLPIGSPCTVSNFFSPVQCELDSVCQGDPTCDPYTDECPGTCAPHVGVEGCE